MAADDTGNAAERAALGAVIALSLALALAVAWHSDDAFTSWRYARDLVDGHGLRSDPGSRIPVEGLRARSAR